MRHDDYQDSKIKDIMLSLEVLDHLIPMTVQELHKLPNYKMIKDFILKIVINPSIMLNEYMFEK